MATVRSLLFALVIGLFCNNSVQAHRVISSRAKCFSTERTIYDESYSFTTLQNGTQLQLSQFRGATWQYPLLNALQEMDGVTVLGFPSNQFGLQEPGRNDEILKILKYVRPGNDYVPNFPVFEKLEVNGNDAHPLYKFLKSQCNLVASTFAPKERLFYEPMHPNDIEWNFHKFLVDHEGKVVRRYHHNVSPGAASLLSDVRALLRRRMETQ